MRISSVGVAVAICATLLSGCDDEKLAVNPGDSLEAARDAVRSWRAQHPENAGKPVVIRLKAGRHEVSSALCLGAEDSNVEWLAEPGAIITGAKEICCSHPVSTPLFKNRLPQTAMSHVVEFDLAGIPKSGDPQYDGDHNLQQRINVSYEQSEAVMGSIPKPDSDLGEMDVFADGKALRRARSPKNRLFKIAAPTNIASGKFVGLKNWRQPVIATKDDYVKRWAGEPNPYVCGNWSCDWVEQRHHVDQFDPQTMEMKLSKPGIGWGYSENQWFYGFNMLCELDEPGEWYADNDLGRLVVWLPEGTKTVEVSVSSRLVEMKGATNVVFSGITFRQSRNTAMTMDGCSNCRVEDCDFIGAGGYGVIIRDGFNCGVSGGEFTDLGGGGVALVDGNRKTLIPSGHYVEDATIHAIGRRYRMYRPAVWLIGVGQRASHNHIYDAPHSAILYFGNDLTISYNNIHEVCKEANDCGALYTGRSGLLRGNAIHYNFIHQILGFAGNFCRTVYLDDGFAADDIYGNVFWQVPWGIFIGGAQDNNIHNNIFVDCPQAVFIDDRGMGWMRSHIDGRLNQFKTTGMNYGCKIAEPPYSVKYPELLEAYTKKDLHQPFGNSIVHNIFWKGDGSFIKKVEKREASDDWWFKNAVQKCPKDIIKVADNLVNVDPMFVDFANGDFSLKPESPAFGIGFKVIPFKEIGPRK